MNASGPGQSPGWGSGGQRPPKAEAFLSQSMPKTQSPGTLVLNNVITINIPKTDPELKKMGGVRL